MPNYEDDIDGGWDRYVSERLDQADSKINTETRVHEFVTSGAAYNETQCNDAITDGDVLVIESEKVVGILYDVAWPVAITQAHGELGSFIAGFEPDAKYADQIAKAVAIAEKRGWAVAGEFR